MTIFRNRAAPRLNGQRLGGRDAGNMLGRGRVEAACLAWHGHRQGVDVRTGEALRAGAAWAAVGAVSSGVAIHAVDSSSERIFTGSAGSAGSAPEAGCAVVAIGAVCTCCAPLAAGTSGAHRALHSLVAVRPVDAVLSGLPILASFAGAAAAAARALRSRKSIRAHGPVHTYVAIVALITWGADVPGDALRCTRG